MGLNWNKDKQITIVDNKEKWETVRPYIEYAPLLAFDWESTGLERNADGVGISLAWDEDHAAYFPLKLFNPDMGLFSPWEESVAIQLKEWLIGQLTTSKRLIGHNAVFDAKISSNTLGIDGELVINCVLSDTQLLHHTVVSEEPPHGLKPLAVQFLEAEAEDSQLDLKESVLSNGGIWLTDNKEMFKGDYNILGRYCAYDTLFTFGLHNRFYPLLKTSNMEDLWNKEVLPMLKVSYDLNTTGFNVNVEYFKELKEKMILNIKDLEAIIYSLIEDRVKEFEFTKILETTTITTRSDSGKLLVSLGWDGKEESIRNYENELRKWYIKKNQTNNVINLDSNNDKAYLLYDVLGFECKTITKSGKRSVTKADMEIIEIEHGENEILQLLVKRSKEQKILSTYVEPFIAKTIDGRIYPSFKQTGTTTGRYSSSDPNFQNIPRDDLRIKAGIIPDKDYVFVAADYSSLEPRIFTSISKEKELHRVYEEELDLYSHVYITLFDSKEYSSKEEAPNFLKKKNPKARQGAKEYTLGFCYGMSEYKLAKILKIEIEEALEIKDLYFKNFPGLLKYQQLCKYRLAKDGFITNLVGRKRRSSLIPMLSKAGVDPYNRTALKKYYDRFRHIRLQKYLDVKAFMRAVNHEVTNAYNFGIQSLAASVVNAACIEIKNRINEHNLNAKIALQIHDEIGLLVHKDHATKVAELLQESMETNWVTNLLTVPMKAAPVITDQSLAEAK